MESNLRPLTLGEILDRTAQLYRSNFLLFAGIFAVYAGVGLAINLLILCLNEWLKGLHNPQILTWTTLSLRGIEVLALFLLFGAAAAAISRAVAWVHLGEPASIAGAYKSILPRLGRYMWLMTLTFFIVWIPFVLLYGGYFGTMLFYAKGLGSKAAGQAAVTPDPQASIIVGIASVVFILLLIPVGIYTILMGLRYALALPASVVEDIKARPSLRRAVALSKGARGRIFVLGLLVGIIKISVFFLSQAFFVVIAFKNKGQMGLGVSSLSEIVAFFTNSFLGPIYAAGITLFYYDQRVRKEGYDIEWMMQAAGLTVPPPAEIEASAVPLPDEAAPAAEPAPSEDKPEAEPPLTDSPHE